MNTYLQQAAAQAHLDDLQRSACARRDRGAPTERRVLRGLLRGDLGPRAQVVAVVSEARP